jgi:hypothetical protein
MGSGLIATNPGNAEIAIKFSSGMPVTNSTERDMAGKKPKADVSHVKELPAVPASLKILYRQQAHDCNAAVVIVPSERT